MGQVQDGSWLRLGQYSEEIRALLNEDLSIPDLTTEMPYARSTASKTCSKCKLEYPADKYRSLPSGKDGLHSICNDCNDDQKTNRWGVPKPKPQYEFCGICASGLSQCQIRVDHCHRTGEFRGYLCQSCNVKLSCKKELHLRDTISTAGTHWDIEARKYLAWFDSKSL